MGIDLLLAKLAEIRANPSIRTFLLADSRDADMAWGIPSFGPARSGQGFRSAPAFLEEIRAVVRQGFVDVMLASVSTMETLAHKERLFDGSKVTPAVRINDAKPRLIISASCGIEPPIFRVSAGKWVMTAWFWIAPATGFCRPAPLSRNGSPAAGRPLSRKSRKNAANRCPCVVERVKLFPVWHLTLTCRACAGKRYRLRAR